MCLKYTLKIKHTTYSLKFIIMLSIIISYAYLQANNNKKVLIRTVIQVYNINTNK